MVVSLGAVRRELNNLLSHAGFQILRSGERSHVIPYQPFKRTQSEAKKAGLSVGDYIDSKFQIPGATQATMDRMCALDVFGKKIETVCEIGPGSGRYLERVRRICNPEVYEIYEPDKEWCNWLVRTFGVTAQDSDGRSLKATADGSMDLVHAHKVFVYLPFVVVCQYFIEMCRVTRLGGHIVFDIVTEECMPDLVVQKWISSAIFYPCIMPRAFVTDLFTSRRCRLKDGFFAPMVPGQSEYLVFVKE